MVGKTTGDISVIMNGAYLFLLFLNTCKWYADKHNYPTLTHFKQYSTKFMKKLNSKQPLRIEHERIITFNNFLWQ